MRIIKPGSRLHTESLWDLHSWRHWKSNWTRLWVNWYNFWPHGESSWPSFSPCWWTFYTAPRFWISLKEFLNFSIYLNFSFNTQDLMYVEICTQLCISSCTQGHLMKRGQLRKIWVLPFSFPSSPHPLLLLFICLSIQPDKWALWFASAHPHISLLEHGRTHLPSTCSSWKHVL